ncbi:MAG: hypothetical protein AMS22_07525 [Thiotrichales bacterium SG8_50]|nr:MAG: hypothetical protein AMS22_07525 [Thiotrichales bacterium SG8_50]
MALLLIEGFEGFGTSAGSAPSPTDVVGRRYSVSAENYMRIASGRTGGYALDFNRYTCYLESEPLTTDDTLIWGAAFKRETTDQVAIVAFYDGSQRGMNLQVAASASEISVYRDATLIDTSTGAGIGTNSWDYIEFKVLCDNTAGTYEVRVNGVNVCSGTGTDTQAGSNAYHDRVRLAPSDTSGVHPTWDDMYVCDSTGSVNNDFLGNHKVVRINPDGDDTTGFGTSTPSANHYENVDETICDDDTSYVEESTNTNKDIWTYGSVASLGTIAGLVVRTMAKETDATDFELITIVESNGTEYDDSGQAMSSSYTEFTRLEEQDPDTNSAWTMAAINAANFGVKVKT